MIRPLRNFMSLDEASFDKWARASWSINTPSSDDDFTVEAQHMLRDVMFLRLISYLSLLLRSIRVGAVVSNRTIDDTYGDSVTGLVPAYTPEVNWDDSSCSPSHCFILPSAGPAFKHNYHSATYLVGGGARTVQLSFQGTAIYIFFILANTVPNSWTETFCDFILDGETSGSFHYAPTSSTDYQYNALVYSRIGLANADHTLLISANGYSTPSFLIFDYAVYTHDDDSGSAQATPSNPTITLNEPGSTVTTVASGTPIITQTNSGYTQSTLVPLNGTTMRNPSNSDGSASAAGYTSGSTSTTSQAITTSSDGQSDHKASVGAIAGGVVGAVALIFITLMSILLCRHRWRASLERPASNGQLTWHAPVLTPFTASFPGRTSFEGALIFSSDHKQQDIMTPSHIPHSSAITASANSEPLRQKRQNMIKRQIKNLKNDLRARGRNGTIDPSQISPSRWGDADLTRMVKQNQAMKTEIMRLHAQLNSDWALGLTDQPPPDYTRNAAGIDHLHQPR